MSARKIAGGHGCNAGVPGSSVGSRVWSVAVKGRILAGKYRLIDELGRGGMGSVWRADHVQLRSSVAVKLIDPILAETREGQSRFLREARAAGSLRSTHVVSVFDYGVDEGTPFLVMELLEGESLAQRLEKRGRLGLTEVQGIMKQVARGLAKAHSAGIVHRDLKPENIFITSEGDTEVVKVLDFGIAKVDANIAVSVQTQTGMVLGTPYYMSPEQAEGRRELDARSDVWSLGVIVFECILGKRPFDGDNLAQIILAICAEPMPVPSHFGAVPAGFDEWFARVVARRLDFRCPSIQEFADELGQIETALPGPVASPVLPLERAPEPRKDDLKNSSLEWSKDPELPTSTNETGAFLPGQTRRTSKLTTVLVAALVVVVAALFVVVAALFVVSGWFWSGGTGPGDSDVAVNPSATTAAAGFVLSEQSAASGETPVYSDEGLDEPRSLPSPRTPSHGTASVSPSATVVSASAPTGDERSLGPAGSPRETTEGVGAGAGVRVPAGLPKGNAPVQPANPSGGYCSHNAISGRLVRSSPGKPGSFPCYVHAISGELRKKE